MPFKNLSIVRSVKKHGFERLIFGCQSGCQESVEILVAQGRLLLSGHSKLFHSLPSASLAGVNDFVRPGTLAAAQANLHIVNRRKNLSVVGAFSRAISIPSVSGPAFQVCGYHIDQLISDPTKLSSGIESQNTPMAACGSGSSLVDCSLRKISSRHLQPGASVNNAIFNSNRSFENCRKASMSLRSKNQPNSFLLYGYFTYIVAKRSGSVNPHEGFGLNRFHKSSPACFSTGTAPDVSFDNPVQRGQYANSADSSEGKIHIGRNLKLNSGSCYLPHPDKEETGGEDAHFICAVQEEPKGSIDPARVLEKAYMCTKAKGSSTACIIALTDQGLHAINLGDSGFMVVRDGCTVFRSPSQQHDFNFTYQLECGNAGDLPSSGQVFKVPVAPGDVIIAGTDGLFDNLYNSDITAVVVHAARAGLGPQVTAQKIAALARQRAQDKNRQTPFSTAAQEAGFRYHGGKLDDITVVVSYITSDNNENSSASHRSS
nr:probable protein phosphatase 2C 55 [Ipomoea batatas]